MKDKIKDASKKNIVEEYQKNLRIRIEELKEEWGKLTTSKESYLEALEGNIKRAPYVLGYLEWTEEKTKTKK